MASTGSLSVAINIFTAPAAAFAAIKEKPSAWLPLLLLLALYSATVFLFFKGVDLAWLMDRQLQQGAAQLTEAQRAQALEAMTSVSPTVYGVGGSVVFSIVIVIIFAILALYYTAVSMATKTGVKFKQWFALICWCTLPALLGLLATIVYLATNDIRFVAQEALNPLSFGNLFSIESEGATTVQRILLSLDPTTLWSLVLSIMGYQAFSRRSIVHAALVVLAPLFVIVLIGLLGSLL